MKRAAELLTRYRIGEFTGFMIIDSMCWLFIKKVKQQNM